MKVSCSHCGGIHERTHVCSKKPSTTKKVTQVDKFRWSKGWQRKRKYIRERDNNLCQVCLRMRYNTTEQYNFTDLEVHHIIPIVSAWDKRLADDNLISVCRYHHELAECGTIPSYELEVIAHENNMKYIL